MRIVYRYYKKLKNKTFFRRKIGFEIAGKEKSGIKRISFQKIQHPLMTWWKTLFIKFTFYQKGVQCLTHHTKKKSDKEDIYPGTSQVPSSSTETFSEGPHHDVNVFGIHAKVVHYPLPMRSQGTYTVCLVQVNIRLVLLF